jgi:hypothetical protein
VAPSSYERDVISFGEKGTLWGYQGARVEELLLVFDAVREEHMGMKAGTFNDDHTYQSRLNQVLV